MSKVAQHFETAIQKLNAQIASVKTRPTLGVVENVHQNVVKALWETATLGQACRFSIKNTSADNLGEVIGIEGKKAVISAFSDCSGLKQGTRVEPLDEKFTLTVGNALLGRIVDGLGNPIDDLGVVMGATDNIAIRQAPPHAMDRQLIDKQLSTGLRAIDGPISLGEGQRIAIFGPPGTGKSSLLSAITQHTEADIIVIGLIGERGREVREFLERHLPYEKREKVVTVAATSDRSPLERFYGAHTATAIAEWHRDQGKSVLLLIDSLTRVARALREIGLARGEAPTRRGYPASVYPALPALIERSGRTAEGSITAIYTVLVEGTGEADPIAEETRSLTDGHIVLSQEIADSGRYPAIDVLKSLSRVMPSITSELHQYNAQRMRELLAKYADIEMLLQVGEFEAGTDETADAAIKAMPLLKAFTKQTSSERSSLSDTLDQMAGALE